MKHPILHCRISGAAAYSLIALLILPFGAPLQAEMKGNDAAPVYRVAVPGLELNFSAQGEIVNGELQGKSLPLGLGLQLEGCHVEGAVEATKLPNSGVSFKRMLVNADGRRCTVVETFTPTNNASVRWELEITGEGVSGNANDTPWSTSITASLHIPPTKETLFWTGWDRPPTGDLLQPAPLSKATTYSYGAPRFTIEKPGMPWWHIGQRPNDESYIALPLVTFIEPGSSGLSLIASPEPMQTDMELKMDPNGNAGFCWYRYRISKENPIRLALDLVPHEPGWRGGLRWMTRRYPGFFDPPNHQVDAMSGCGNYSTERRDLDVPELRRMDFSVLWIASFDFPYMGMFLPPVKKGEVWKSFPGKPTSFEKMNGYAQWMRSHGFHLLSYFNVTEFGAKVTPVGQKDLTAISGMPDPDWKDSNDFLFKQLTPAIVRVPKDLNLSPTIKWPGGWEPTSRGGFYYTWEKGIVLDCGEPVYRKFLLEQARRHIEELPDSAGICIDRLDWLRLFNLDRDDHISWFDGKPSRSLVVSWRTLLDELGPLMHEKGKFIFVNSLDKRLDLMQQIDGIFDECPGVDGDALLGMRKPVLIFNAVSGDEFLQKCLYLGVYPSCPFPGSDHGMGWGTPEIRKPFLDYGPLLGMMRGKKWVLEPDCVTVVENKAKANLFAVPNGHVVPVVFGGSHASVDVTIRNVAGITKDSTCTANYPGVKQAVTLPLHVQGDGVTITVPLQRGCAMLLIK